MDFPEDDRLPNIKALGMLWKTQEDAIRFSWAPPSLDQVWTLRKVSSYTGRLFDPLGLIAPLTIRGRLVVQACWAYGLSWDHPLSGEILQQWLSILKDWHTLDVINIPRCIKDSHHHAQQSFVVFSDASSRAVAAAMYVISTFPNGDRGSRLLTSRSKVAPSRKAESIPRLELQGAVVATVLARDVARAWSLYMTSIQFFEDSMTVLWWLRTDKPLSVYVTNRVCAVLDHTPLAA